MFQKYMFSFLVAFEDKALIFLKYSNVFVILELSVHTLIRPALFIWLKRKIDI